MPLSLSRRIFLRTVYNSLMKVEAPGSPKRWEVPIELHASHSRKMQSSCVYRFCKYLCDIIKCFNEKFTRILTDPPFHILSCNQITYGLQWARSGSRNVFSCSYTRNMDSNPTQDMDAKAFILCLCLPCVATLLQAWSFVRGGSYKFPSRFKFQY
jgi:hypothetical protein